MKTNITEAVLPASAVSMLLGVGVGVNSRSVNNTGPTDGAGSPPIPPWPPKA